MLGIVISFFYRVFLFKYLTRVGKKKDRGYSIPEIIVASAISLFTLVAAYSLIAVMLETNKSDDTSVKLHSKTDFALDYMIDEINSSKKVVIDWQNIPAKCRNISGTFLIGLIFPEQAFNASYYTSAGLADKNKLWKKSDCPIIYSLSKDSNRLDDSYQILRKGMMVDNNGYYIPLQTVESLILDGVSNKTLEPTSCAPRFHKREVNGVTICADKFGRGAEIAISVNEKLMHNKSLDLLKTSAGYSRIQDDSLLGYSNDSSDQPCNDPKCNIGGIPIVSKLITFHLDASGSMAVIVSASGLSRMTMAKIDLINAIEGLKICKKPSPNCVKLQVVVFSNTSTNLFARPIELTDVNKERALQKIKKIRPGGSTRPWSGLMSSVKNEDVSQIIVIGDGDTQGNKGYCPFTKTNIAWIDCISIYNSTYRQTTKAGTVQIDAISIGNDFCRGNGWMGQLTSKNNGNCMVR